MIMNVIHELAKTKTVLLISHRLYNVTGSDRIYMLSGGKIVESGTFQELMEKQGIFAKLYENQRKLEEYKKEVQA